MTDAASRPSIEIPPDGTIPRGVHVPLEILKWLRDPCSWALQETLELARRDRGPSKGAMDHG